ncbi:hypothetical protein A0H81_05601 [Grifola frondosa]|uniref:Uncharacterized protein n=1 Tax=Grifola frondosa TaxID=5627 RepID=A0A1C7MDL4_GRIFR|nr:hypothetical protein A0H81_05601 [Grifola frondosa]
MHALHNAHLIRAILPRNLTAPIPLFTDRRTKHFEIAKMLRDSQETKRAARKAANDAKKATAVSIVEEGLDEFSSRKRRREDAPE